MRAVGKNVIVQPVSVESKTEIYTGEDKRMPTRGVVVAIGSQVSNVETGHNVMFTYGQQVRSFTEGGIQYLVMPETVIDAIVD